MFALFAAFSLVENGGTNQGFYLMCFSVLVQQVELQGETTI